MSFGIYMVGFIILIIGLATGAFLMHMPPDVDRRRCADHGRSRDLARCHQHAAARFVELAHVGKSLRMLLSR